MDLKSAAGDYFAALSAPKRLPKLYHGTTIEAARRAFVEGLRPRDPRSRGNWKHTVESATGVVYLTTVYAPYFAVQAGNSSPETHSGVAILEIDPAYLERDAMLPDEDALEFLGRGKDGLKNSMKDRVRFYRKRLANWRGQPEVSLDLMGTCGHFGVVPAEAITRVATLSTLVRESAELLWRGMNAQVSPHNFRFCGAEYAELTRRIFDDPCLGIEVLSREEARSR